MKHLSRIIGFIVVLLVSVALAFDNVPGNFREFGGTDGQDYYSRHRDSVFVDLDGHICKIMAIGTAEGLYPDEKDGKVIYKRGSGIFALAGSAFHIGNGYFVTAYHVIRPETVEIRITSNFIYSVPVDRVTALYITIGNSETGHIGATVVWENPAQDLAIVRVQNSAWSMLRDLGYKLVYTKRFVPVGLIGGTVIDELQPGTVVATIVRRRVNVNEGDFSFDNNYEVRYGKIVEGCVKLPKGVPDTVLPWFNTSDVTSTLTIYPGDSGSPVFAFVDGVPVLIGVVRAIASGNYYDEEFGWCSQRYSYFSRIDAITRKTKEVQ